MIKIPDLEFLFENHSKQDDLDEEYNYVGFIKWFHTGFIKLDPPGNGSFLNWCHTDPLAIINGSKVLRKSIEMVPN